MKKSNWLQNGFLNVFEHGLTRGFDALSTLVVLKVLPTETFGVFAIAQAWVNLSLFLFLSPEGVFYRDYGHWVNDGAHSLTSRIRILRRFSWLKLPLFILLSAVFAAASGRGLDFFYALAWAFSITLAPQITGADREFLRVDLKLKALNFVTFFQKTLLFVGTIAAALWTRGELRTFAAIAFISLILSMLLCRLLAQKALREMRLASDASGSQSSKADLPKNFLWNVMKDFTIWWHLSGNVWNWLLTADVLFLSWTGLSERSVGLYSSALKLANLSHAFPTALQSVFSIWLGRKAADWAGSKQAFPPGFVRIWLGYAAGVIAQAVVLWFASPYLFAYLSKQKWSAEELMSVNHFFRWMLVSTVLVALGNLHQNWFIYRTLTQRFFLKVILPWGLTGAALTAAFCFAWGQVGALWARQGVALLYVGALVLYTQSQKKARTAL